MKLKDHDVIIQANILMGENQESLQVKKQETFLEAKTSSLLATDDNSMLIQHLHFTLATYIVPFLVDNRGRVLFWLQTLSWAISLEIHTPLLQTLSLSCRAWTLQMESSSKLIPFRMYTLHVKIYSIVYHRGVRISIRIN